MAHADYNVHSYETPSSEIILHRKEFYNLWKRCDDRTADWVDRIQSLIDRCKFPSMITKEYLLIDKFVSELGENEQKILQCTNHWTLTQLVESLDMNFLIDKTNEQKSSPSIEVDIKSEIVSNPYNTIHFR